jgi:hypothetical protein
MTGSFFEFNLATTAPEIVLELCNSPATNKIFKDTIDTYHSYVKFKSIPSRRIHYLAYENKTGNLIGALGISGATYAISCRDVFIGWTEEQKKKNLIKIANNSRFCLIQQNITIKNAGTMCLKQLRINGAKQWKDNYGDNLVLLETFVQAERDDIYNGKNTRSGAIYKADNWIEVGWTKGSSIQKAPMKMWMKEKGERGRLAREDKEACLKKYYLDGSTSSGYKITKSKKKIVFVKPLIKLWKKELLT